MKEIPAPNLQSVSPVHVQFGKVIPAQQQILLYNFLIGRISCMNGLIVKGRSIFRSYVCQAQMIRELT